MHIRPATIADAAAIAAIYNVAVQTTTASFDVEPKSVDDRMQWLEHRDQRHPVIVAVDDDIVVGWGAFSRYSERPAYAATVEISIYVDADHQRLGVGRALSRALLDMAESLGIHTVLARICTENTASIAMVRELGFSDAGTMHEVGRKFDRWLDVATWEYLVPGYAESRHGTDGGHSG
ncbi:MAG: N-acetyltransferase [Aeromicrobium sp.]|jgi:phosphinothricin acetyltransferase|nr:N-acetyltransferase [Aeromicrobium sp.]